MIKINLDKISFIYILTQADQYATLQINLISSAKKIMKDLK